MGPTPTPSSGPRPSSGTGAGDASPHGAPAGRSREALLVAALVLVALALRLPTLGDQSLWLDEVYTGRIVDGSLGHVWSTIQRTENTPPLFYLLDWLWSRAFGTGDAALRGLSAVAGALAVLPVIRLLRTVGEDASREVREDGSGSGTRALADGTDAAADAARRRPATVGTSPSAGRAGRLGAGLVGALGRPAGGVGPGVPFLVVLGAGGLIAVNPLAHWFSQEARSYALFVLVSAVAWAALLRAAGRPTTQSLWIWAVAAVAAAWTHYFGVVLLLVGWTAIAVVLDAGAAGRRRTALRPMVPPAVASAVGVAALAPIAINQQSTGMYEAISAVKGLPARIVETPKQFAVGYNAPAEVLVGALVVLVLVVLVAAGAWPRGGRATRGTVLLGLTGAVWVLPMVPLVGGFDVVLTRNYVLLMPPLIVLAALGAWRIGRRGAVAVGAVALVQLVILVLVAVTPTYQREDWRGLMRAAEAGQPGPELLLIGAYQKPAATYYSPMLVAPDLAQPVAVRSVAVVDRLADGEALEPVDPPPPPAGFTLARTEQRDQWRVFVWTAPVPTVIAPGFADALAPTSPRTPVLRP